MVLYIGVTYSGITREGAMKYCLDRCFDGASANTHSVFSWGCISYAPTDFSNSCKLENARV